MEPPSCPKDKSHKARKCFLVALYRYRMANFRPNSKKSWVSKTDPKLFFPRFLKEKYGDIAAEWREPLWRLHRLGAFPEAFDLVADSPLFKFTHVSSIGNMLRRTSNATELVALLRSSTGKSFS